MPRLRRLSGPEAIKILVRFGFSAVAGRGSHVKLHRFTPDGRKQVLTVPNHRELDTGTLHGIFRQASRFIPADELRPHFYSE